MTTESQMTMFQAFRTFPVCVCVCVIASSPACASNVHLPVVSLTGSDIVESNPGKFRLGESELKERKDFVERTRKSVQVKLCSDSASAAFLCTSRCVSCFVCVSVRIDASQGQVSVF